MYFNENRTLITNISKQIIFFYVVLKFLKFLNVFKIWALFYKTRKETICPKSIPVCYQNLCFFANFVQRDMMVELRFGFLLIIKLYSLQSLRQKNFLLLLRNFKHFSLFLFNLQTIFANQNK